MQSFRIRAEMGVYLLREGIEDRIGEETQYLLFAADKGAATKLAESFIGEKCGSSSPRISHAVFDEIETWIESWHPTPKYEGLFGTVKRLKPHIGSIKIEGVLITTPYNNEDSLIIVMSEGEKQRVLSEPLFIMEDGRRVEWGNDESSFQVQSLARAIQALF